MNKRIKSTNVFMSLNQDYNRLSPLLKFADFFITQKEILNAENYFLFFVEQNKIIHSFAIYNHVCNATMKVVLLHIASLD